MQTHFSPAQLADSDTAVSEQILRKCVHCGFCTATCPTYLILGDELDSPRGRIRLIQDMLEAGGPPSPDTVKHIDRCLSCLSCRTTCPSGVDYMHLVDHARAYIEKNHRRPLGEWIFRDLLTYVLPRPGLFRWALRAGLLAKGLRLPLPRRAKGLLNALPERPPRENARVTSSGEPASMGVPSPSAGLGGSYPAFGERRGRVALLAGCVQSVLAPQINQAAIRLLTRHGIEVVVPPDAGCCGSMSHHAGQSETARAFARRNIAAWKRLMEDGGLDAVVTTTSGCGTTMKDYGFLFRDDPTWATAAAQVGALVKDISELIGQLDLVPATRHGTRVAYHAPCSLRHGQGIDTGVKRLLTTAGFVVSDIPENHICCGSAGTYSLLQLELATQLRARKLANLERMDAQVVATGNIGCLNQLASGSKIPIVHTVQLLDWATGGPKPF